MIRIKANIYLYKNRKTPLHSGYRPVFDFIKETKAGGQIKLIDSDELLPGETEIVEITFFYSKSLGEDFAVGKKFTFGEGTILLGEGVVLEIYESDR